MVPPARAPSRVAAAAPSKPHGASTTPNAMIRAAVTLRKSPSRHPRRTRPCRVRNTVDGLPTAQ